VAVPGSWLEEMSRLDGVGSLEDTKKNAVQGELVQWLKERPDAVEALGVTPAELAHWKSAGRLARLVLRWRETRLAGDEAVFEKAEAWRRQDRHLVEWEAQGRDQLIASRREVYRVLAARLVAAYGCFVAEDMDIPKLTRKGKPEDGPDYMEEAARKSARYAAPGSLRAAIKLAAGREGVKAMEVPSMGTTKVHSLCGTWLDHDFSEQIMAWCPKCEMGFDQDANACENLLKLATGEVVEFTHEGPRLPGQAGEQ
jgi:transposase